MGDTVVVLGARADVEVGAERPGDLGGHELADRLAGDPPHELALEEALGDRVVARRRSRLPPRLLGRQQGRRLVPVVERLDRHRSAPARQAGGVAHHVTNLDARLVVGSELRPELVDRGVQVELALIGEHETGQRRHGLRRRPDVDDRVGLPRPLGAVVADHRAAPQVDDELTFDRHGDRCPDVGGARRRRSCRRRRRGRRQIDPHTRRGCPSRDRTLWAMSIFEHPVHTLSGEPSSLAQIRRVADVDRQRGVALWPDAAVHRPRGAAGALRRSRFQRRRLPVQPVRRAGAGHAPRRSQTFCSTTYGVTFPMMEKIDVNGPRRTPDLRRAHRRRRRRGPRRRHPLELREVPRRQGRLDHPLLADGRTRGPRPGRGDRGRTQLTARTL